MHDVIIIGAGLVGLGVANALQETNPMLRILILEKENGPAAHQSGHNSNVVHSGIYYTPGSLRRGWQNWATKACSPSAASMTSIRINVAK